MKAILDRIALLFNPEYPNNHPDRSQPASAATQGGRFWVPFFNPKTAQVRRTQLKRRLIESWDEMVPFSFLTGASP